ncbi:MAG: hypothetical protein P4M11_09075, partial [Candidatus Pacebacteria bacterium]|nr:hypothetical protein [Candidatus Paceibacterota bacterium]
ATKLIPQLEDPSFMQSVNGAMGVAEVSLDLYSIRKTVDAEIEILRPAQAEDASPIQRSINESYRLRNNVGVGQIHREPSTAPFVARSHAWTWSTAGGRFARIRWG